MAIWILAAKDLRLLIRDWRAGILMLVTPLVLVLILGMLVNDGFGQKPDDRRRVSIVDLDAGNPDRPLREAAALLSITGNSPSAPLGSAVVVDVLRTQEPWSKIVQRDLAQTASIRLEMIPTLEEAQGLIRESRRSAVLVFGNRFSERIDRCSFLADGINPFFRDGVRLDAVDARLLIDETQLADAKITEQVAQVTLLRVVLPWMIGRAFERLSEEQFIDMLCNEVYLPVPRTFRPLFILKGEKLDAEGKASLLGLLRVASDRDPALMADYKQRVGKGVQTSLQIQFEKYNLLGKNWADLTRSAPHTGPGAEVKEYVNESGLGPLRRGAVLYQVLVPSSLVMFAFFLVLSVGWLFVSERRQGTLKRLRAAPLSHTQILLGKLLPCFVLSIVQGMILLGAGRLVFGMQWGPDPLWLLPVVGCTSLAAMGLALVVAAIARTEVQVAVYGTLLVLGMALISGCIYPRAWMSDWINTVSYFTPHAWALDAYNQLLLNRQPNFEVVGRACGVLAGFGTGFLGLAWGFLRLE